MPLTYPGVYIEELPSGVRTITGVGTSIALFVGRTTQGPVGSPQRILNPTAFGSTFSWDDPGGDLPRAVRLFFANGGSDCYVMRIAAGAMAASVTFNTEASTGPAVNQMKPSLKATARSAGVVGNTIRLAVNYRTLVPESTFNLEVFRASQDSQGNTVKNLDEVWTGLSMDPSSPRYAPDYVTQNSSLITLADATAGAGPSPTGTSQAGRPVQPADWKTLIGSASTNPTNRFRISADGGPFVEVDLSSIVVGAQTPAQIATAIAAAINPRLRVGSTVTVTIAGGPGTANWLTISSANGDVLIQPAATNDLAVPLMLGSGQGGIEISRFAKLRPAATGIVFDIKNLTTLAGLAQNSFDTVTLDGTDVSLGTKLVTVGNAALLYQDALLNSVTGNNDGVREKWNIIAGIINASTVKYAAEVWGSRLALIPTANDNAIGTIVTKTTTDIGPNFNRNVRYFTVGSGGSPFYQQAAADGNDGTAPAQSDYQIAYQTVDSQVDLFNLLVLPTDGGHTSTQRASLWGDASAFCDKRRAFLLMDAPQEWTSTDAVLNPTTGISSLRIGLTKDHAAIFFPWLTIGENGVNRNVGPSGAIAGLIARIDSAGGSGVWVAPAGTNADVRGGVVGLASYLSNDQNGLLNPHGVNTLRRFPIGIVNWGARTMDGDDDFASQWKYIPIRRLALFIEESLYRGTQWVVFQPNDEPLWAQIRLNVGVFMQGLFRQGAFEGKTPQQAYFVKCDGETTLQSDIDLGVVNIVVGFAPLKPAEFVVIKIQQMAGRLAV